MVHEPILLHGIDGEYRDEYNNVLIGCCKDCRITIYGCNNHVNIHNANLHNTSIFLGDDNCLEVGEDSIVADTALFFNFNSSQVHIGHNVQIVRTEIHLFGSAQFKVGNYTTFEPDGKISIPRYSSIDIGEDCLFSTDVRMHANDGHSIFDVNTGKNINLVGDKQYHHIKIGKHVWIGQTVYILGDADIGQGSIVGAKSFVKGSFPNNCIIAGIPAKIIAKDRAWSRIPGTEDINSCGIDNVRRTCSYNEVK